MKRQLIPTLAGLLFLLALGWYIDSLAHNEITEALRWIIYGLAYATIIALVGIAIFAILIVRERVLKERAARQLAEREAAVMVVTADEGQQVYIRDTNQTVVWRNAHLDVRVYANGQSS